MPAPRTAVPRARPAADRGARTAVPPRTPPTAARPAAGRPALTPEQAEVLRALLAARAGGAAPPGRATRAPGGRPRSGRSGRSSRARTSRRRRRRPASRRWRLRLPLLALGLVLPVLAGLLGPAALPGGPVAGPAGTAGLALQARATLLEGADRYRRLEQEADRRRAALQQAEQAARAAREAATAAQAVVGAAAAGLYRTPAPARHPVLGLSVHDPGAVPGLLHGQALADRSQRALESTVVRAARAEAAADAAARRVADARADVDAVLAEAAAALAGVREETARLSPDVAASLAALDTAPAAGAQQEHNERALRRWQESLGLLAAAGIDPPPAAALADPGALPPGMSPLRDGSGRPVPGVALTAAGNRVVTVLPAETVTAVSAAFSQLGRPYAAGRAGPDAYDCGGLTAASWLLAGHALPATPAGQWAEGTPVPADQLQVGDLVVSDGGADVGIYVGEGEVVGASAATYQVGVLPLRPGWVAVRVPLPAAAATPAPLPAAATGNGPCGAPPAPAGPASPAWGGWSNGRIPRAALCPIGRGHALRCDAAAGYTALAEAFAATFGRPLCITDSYRSLAAQVDAARRKPALAAVPGTSNHGWALAVDLCGGVNVAGTPEWTWMTANAGRFGFVQPGWARPGGEKPEPWHWEFGRIS